MSCGRARARVVDGSGMKRDILGMALCGGASSRMGEDKAALRVRPGLTQLEYALGLLGLVCCRVAAGVGPAGRAGRELPDGVEAIADAAEVAGPMAGAIAGLRAADGWPLLLLAADMPFLEASHLVQLVNRRDSAKLATAFVAADGQLEPMAALYEPGCLALMERHAAEGKSSLRRFLGGVPVERIALDRPELLASVNDPEALARARRTLS